MTAPTTTNALILVGYGTNGQTAGETALAAASASALGLPVDVAFLEAAPSVGEGIQLSVATHQPRYIIVQPLFVGANASKSKNIALIVDAANERGFASIAHYAQPLGTHAGVIDAYADSINAVLQTLPEDARAQTALLVVGRGSRDAEPNAEVYQVARLLYEKTGLATSDVAFCGATQPDIAAGIKRIATTDAKYLIVVPYALYDEALIGRIREQVTRQQTHYPALHMQLTPALGAHAGILAALRQRYDEALSELKAQLSSDGQYISRPHSHGGVSHQHALVNLLPPRYQGDSSVSAAPMGAADLVYDAAGQVAWDEIWGDFCDLALAGGPPHRGTLLEPVAPEIVRANPEQYHRVLAELARGIRMITKLPVIVTAALGWIGVECTDEAMALWLLRAIIVENVSVRREGHILYFPASPTFRLEYEIKNVITVIAKTHHYWTEHVTNQRANGA